VETDEHENKNLINSFPDKANSMKKLLIKWGKDLHHPGFPDGKIVRKKNGMTTILNRIYSQNIKQ